MTRRCPICGLSTFTEEVIRTGYLNNSTIWQCSNCTWKKVVKLSGPGGPAIEKLVTDARKEFLQVLRHTGSVKATATELKARAARRQTRNFAAAQAARQRPTSSTRRRSPALPRPTPPRPARSRNLLQRALLTTKAAPPGAGCNLCGNTHSRHETGSNQCQATATWRKIEAGEWLKRSQQEGFDKVIAMAWPEHHQHKAVTNVYARAKAGRSIVLQPVGADTTAALTKARVRLWCSLNPDAAPAQAFLQLYST